MTAVTSVNSVSGGAIDLSRAHTDHKERSNVACLTASGAIRNVLEFECTGVDVTSLADGVGTTLSFTGCTDVALGDIVTGVSFGVDLQGITVTGYVKIAGEVNVRVQNESGGTLDLASTTVRFVVLDVTP